MKTISTALLPKKIATVIAAVFVCASFSSSAEAQGTESWREFARRSMMPDYSWNTAPSAQSLAPSLHDLFVARGTVAARINLNGQSSTANRSLSLYLDTTRGFNAERSGTTQVQTVDFEQRQSPLQNRLLDATYEQDAGEKGRLGLSALVAQQQFATPGFGLMTDVSEALALMPGGLRSNTLQAPSEVSKGHGVRLDYRLALTNTVAWQWTAQSKLAFDAFRSVWGMDAEPGKFDLPARLGWQTEWQASHSLALVLGMERVYYSDIQPFTSIALPARLLSLMADGNAPAFAWQDLTVYSAEGRLRDQWGGEWALRYSTRQQPLPTAALYQRALSTEYAQSNIALGYRHQLWVGSLNLTASYAPSMAFLGPGPVFSQRTFSQGAKAEFEAIWAIPF